MDILDPSRMREADRITIEELKVPGLLLMENAGRAVAEAVVRTVDDAGDRIVLVFAGPGHNGGDGFVAARHLARLGVACEVLLIGARHTALKGDPRTMADAWVGLGGSLIEIPDLATWERTDTELGPDALVIDAIYGTGLARPLDGLAAAAVDAINESGAWVLAVDVPSGVDAGHSQPIGPCVHADVTVTFARPKPAHLLPPVEVLSGELIVVDIGIPPRAVAATKPDLHWADESLIAGLVPGRTPLDHKGDFGHLLVVAGSVGKAGAAAITGWSALQSGAGLVTVATPGPARAEVALFAPELMTEPLPFSDDGELERGASLVAMELLDTRDVLALGPGLGQGETIGLEIRALVAESDRPIVLDADGLNAFAGDLAALATRRSSLVVTPHPGEAARLLSCSPSEVQADRLLAARRIARDADAVCVLKGFRTIVAAPDGQALVNSTGNPGMATAGMGDALTGLIAGFMAQGLEPFAAASLAVYLHGLAGDIAVEEEETHATLSTTALLRHLPAALRRLTNEDLDEP
ncbi:MAG: NAD(P)H-hydrate dehydratase [Acidobacteriota bacterium]